MFSWTIIQQACLQGDLQPDEDPMENFEDPVYDESLLEAVPEDFRDFSLDKIIRTAIHLENFRQFLQVSKNLLIYRRVFLVNSVGNK